MFPEYTYDPTTGWQPTTLPRLPDTAAPLGTLLFDAGYLIMANSHDAPCAVGGFVLWQRETAAPDWPHYAIEITQVDDQGVVWIATLPALWEWLRLYGTVARSVSWYDADNDEDEGEDVDVEVDLYAGDGDAKDERHASAHAPHIVHICPDCLQALQAMQRGDTHQAHQTPEVN
jgi:hypothetical protein